MCIGVGPRYRCAAGVAGHQLRPPHQPQAVYTPHRPLGLGRFGRKGVAINFVKDEDVRALRDIEQVNTARSVYSIISLYYIKYLSYTNMVYTMYV